MIVEISVKQITNGSEYEGVVKGLGKDIKYRLLFGVPINKLDSQKVPTEKSEIKTFARRMFKFTVTKSNDQLDLSDELFGFMFGTAGHLAISFYNDPQTEDYNSNSGLISDAINNKEKSLLGSFGSEVSIEVSKKFDISDDQIPSVLK